jgi:hypothetical protein
MRKRAVDKLQSSKQSKGESPRPDPLGKPCCGVLHHPAVGKSCEELMRVKAKLVTGDSAKPTTEQLANLVAALSKNLPTETPEFLAKRALGIWEAAYQLLTNPPPPTHEVPNQHSQPEPNSYPVTLDQFLKLMLPHFSGRTGEKFFIFRQYLAFRLRNPLPPASVWAWDQIPQNPIAFDCLNPRIVPGITKACSSQELEKRESAEPNKDDVDRYLALWKTQPVPDATSFAYHSLAFQKWYANYHTSRISAVRRAAILKRHKPEGTDRKHKSDKTSGDTPSARR